MHGATVKRKKGDFKFERTDSFTYPGSVLNNGNRMRTDIRSKIMAATVACSSYNNTFVPKLSSGNTKLKICKIRNRPFLSYRAEAC